MIYKHFRKIKLTKEKTNSKVKNFILRVITGLLWILFTLYLVWIIVSLTWGILSEYFDNNLYVPNSINFIFNTFSYTLIWIISVSIGFFIIYKYKKLKRKIKINTSSNTSHDYGIDVFDYNLMNLDSNNKDEYMIIKNILENQELNQIFPSKMLSYGIILYNKGLVKESMSILRLVIEHEDSSPLLVEVAKNRLLQMLPHSD